jgi:protein Tex
LPYKAKRSTRFEKAIEKGLEPLAEQIWKQEKINIEALVQTFISDEKGVSSIEEALAGARDIIAEKINQDADARNHIRQMYQQEATLYAKVLKGKEDEGQKYKDYFEWEESLKNAPSHRILALRRAEKEGILTLDIEPNEEQALNYLQRKFVSSHHAASRQVEQAAQDAYKRLIKPSIETQIRLEVKKRAEADAIAIFAQNLKQLLLAPPFGQRSVLAIDPGFRTGSKITVLDAQGKLLEYTTIYPNEPQKQTQKAAQVVAELVRKHKVAAIAIGNGTASRQTYAFCKEISSLPKDLQLVVVNESGASIYSASEVAREEFPDLDISYRGAVSIGRRLIDPLAELVKIDPKSIGVGQYQHDVDQKLLKKTLEDTVVSCVSSVGVEVNTASKELLSHVAGLNSKVAQTIVEYRNENGAFKSRKELLKVPRLGAKSFEQAAGFLRIRNAKNPLDASAVHPESYPIVEKIAQDLGCTISELIANQEQIKQLDVKKYVSEKVGLPTLQDIVAELQKPGRDPRETFEEFAFSDAVQEIEDLQVGMKLKGIVTNITDFGAFVDIGVHQDGLIHISQLADTRVSHPTKVVRLQQKVEVTVMEVDVARRRIALSLKTDPFATPHYTKPQKKQQEEPQEAFQTLESNEFFAVRGSKKRK